MDYQEAGRQKEYGDGRWEIKGGPGCVVWGVAQMRQEGTIGK